MNLCPVLVGRREQLAALGNALRDGGVVLVVGEAGIGKSRLLREFAEEARAEGHPVLWGRPELVSEPGPYSLIIDLLDSIAGTASEAATEALELAEALAAPKPGASEPPARQIAARTRGLIGSSGPRPLVMIEDLHAADEPSQAVIAHLARSSRDDGSLLVAALRVEEASTEGTARFLEVLTRDRLATTIELPRLTTAELGEMLLAMWGERPLDDEFENIEELAEGIPFFVEELAAARGSQLQVPESIARSVRARLESLDDVQRRVIQTASLVSGAIDPLIVAEAASVPEREIAGALVAGMRAGLLVDEGGRLAFRHGILREAAANSIVSVERTDLHRALAAAIEKHRQDELDRYATALAGHYLSWGDHEGAAKYQVMAGERALTLAAYEEARVAFEQAVHLEPSEDVLFRATVGLAEALLRLLRPRECIGVLESYQSRGLPPDREIEVAIRMGDAYQVLRDARGQGVFVRALEVLQGVNGDDLRARVLISRGRWLLSVGELNDARGDLLIAAELATKAGDDRLRARASATLVRLLTALQDQEGAEGWGRQAMNLGMIHGLDDIVAETFSAEAMRHALLGQGREGLALLEEAKEHLTRGLSSYLSVHLDQVMAWILQRMGQPEDASRVAARLEATGLAHGQGRVILVWAAIERNQFSWAVDFMNDWWNELGRRARSASPQQLWDMPEESHDSAYALLAESILHAFGESVPSDEARDLVERNDAFSRIGISETASHATLLSARVAIRREELDRAARLLDEAQEFVNLSGPFQRAHALELHGTLLRTRGDAGEASRVLEEAIDVFARADNSSDRARVIRLLAGLVDKSKARELLKQARGICLSCGALSELARTEAAMREIGMRPRAGRPRGSGRKKGELTGREEEVVALVAAGATNAEIAARLFVSDRTVEDHLHNAQRSLGISGRAGLAAWAAKKGLI